MIALKCVSFKRKSAPLPYDAEVEYLESTETQYIDTGIKPNTETRLEIEFKPTRLDGTYRAFCASRTSNSSADQFSFVFSSGLSFAGFGQQEKQIGGGGGQSAGTVYSITMDKTSLHGTWRTSSSSGNIPTVNFDPKTVSSNLSLYMFGRNTAGTATSFSYCQMYYCKLYDNGVLVRDFIPVRKNGVGYMYDRVSGELFGNSGTGSFVIGPDK